ncbi:MAG: hypothetical protein Q8O19_05725 [Rectinemataceae bacterium]|nr:hypothetical protein [Rectinemataceae bacterium]
MTKPIAVIHTDALRREYPANWVLGKGLEKLGYRVILTSRPTTSRLLRLFAPEVLILSHVFSLSGDELASLHKRGTRIYANEVEGEIEGNEQGISGTYPEGIAYHLFEKIFTWSEWSAGWLVAKHKVDPGRVSAVGSTRLSLLKHITRKGANRRIGVIGRFELLNTFDGRHPFENLMSMDTGEIRGATYIQRAMVEMDSFAVTTRVIEALVNKGLLVSIRPHPNESIKAYQFLQRKYGPRLEVDGSHDYAGWLDGLSVVVGTLSSAFTEPYLLGIPIVSLDALQNTNYTVSHLTPFVETFSQACYRPTSVLELVQLCTDPRLEPVVNPVLNQQLAAIYSLDKHPNPIQEVLTLIGAPREGGAKNASDVLVGPTKGLMDIVVLLSCLLRDNPKVAYRTHQIYDYNSIIHSPSSFMKEISFL